MLAFLYAGQGSQRPGMGRDFYDTFPAARPFFDSAAAGFDLKELCFEASAEALSKTSATQPCMGAFAAAVTKLLESEGIVPFCTAGLSLGEYGALHAAGVFSAEALLALLSFRGRAMEDAAEGTASRMSAVLGLENAAVERAVASVPKEAGVVACCNYNCPGQLVIGGEERAVLLAEAECARLGAKRVVPLATSGPFHTPLMAPAAQRLERRLAGEKMGDMRLPVVFNATGEALREGETVRGLLVEQVKSPVLFEKSVRTMAAMGVTAAVEIGPGRTLAGFVKKTAPEIKVWSVEDVPSFESAVTALKGMKI